MAYYKLLFRYLPEGTSQNLSQVIDVLTDIRNLKPLRKQNVQILQNFIAYFDIFHTCANTNVAHKVIATLNTHASVYCSIFHTLRSPRSLKDQCGTASLVSFR